MVQRTGGFRKKTRDRLAKHPRDKGKVSTTRLMQVFEIGDKVIIKQEPAIHNAMPHPRYKGRTGVVTEKRGYSVMVTIKDGGKTKHLISAPVHLRRAAT
ncbi:MAG: 50S ribosomal protein L21e [DPANN group archaeon]|nr:50S ribosomal protein L21e [DPANN group archaeon]